MEGGGDARDIRSDTDFFLPYLLAFVAGESVCHISYALPAAAAMIFLSILYDRQERVYSVVVWEIPGPFPRLNSSPM